MNFDEFPGLYFTLFKFAIAASETQDSKFVDFMIQVGASLLGFGGAYLLFRWGNNHVKERGKIEKIEYEKDKLRYLHHLIEGSRKFSGTFNIGLETVIKQVNDDSTIVNQVIIPHYNDLDRFVNKINQEEHFHAYRNQKLGSDSIKLIFNRLDFIETLRLTFLEALNEIIKKNNERRKHYADLVEETRNLLSKYKAILESQGMVETPIYSDFTNALYAYGTSSEDGDFTRIKDQFLIPLSKIIYSYQETTKDFQYQDLFQLTAKTASSLTNLVRNNKAWAKELEADLKNLKSAIDDLDEQIPVISKFIASINKP